MNVKRIKFNDIIYESSLALKSLGIRDYIIIALLITCSIFGVFLFWKSYFVDSDSSETNWAAIIGGVSLFILANAFLSTFVYRFDRKSEMKALLYAYFKVLLRLIPIYLLMVIIVMLILVVAVFYFNEISYDDYKNNLIVYWVLLCAIPMYFYARLISIVPYVANDGKPNRKDIWGLSRGNAIYVYIYHAMPKIGPGFVVFYYFVYTAHYWEYKNIVFLAILAWVVCAFIADVVLVSIYKLIHESPINANSGEMIKENNDTQLNVKTREKEIHAVFEQSKADEEKPEALGDIYPLVSYIGSIFFLFIVIYVSGGVHTSKNSLAIGLLELIGGVVGLNGLAACYFDEKFSKDGKLKIMPLFGIISSLLLVCAGMYAISTG